MKYPENLTPAEHYREAEWQLAAAAEWAEADAARAAQHQAQVLPAQVQYALKAAQVHAELAQVRFEEA